MMSSNILPYSKVLNDRDERDYILVQFSGINVSILVHEAYCVNPDCDCKDAILKFFELSEDEVSVNEWFSIRLDMQTWLVTDKTVLNKMINVQVMIEEFMVNIDELKETLLAHYMRVKAYGKKNVLDYLSNQTVKMILDGEMLAYSEMLGSAELDEFFIELNQSEKWFFDDQYCTNPKCLCNETVLTFFKRDDATKTLEADFAVRLDLKRFKYDVEFDHIGAGLVSEVMVSLLASKPELLGILKRRYNEVKSTSKEVIRKYGVIEKKEALPNIKVGRNDPCPCGSGKKYKKCCGIGR